MKISEYPPGVGRVFQRTPLNPLLYFPGSLTLDGFRKDLDRELFVYTDITDENLSWYFEENKQTCLDPLLCHYLDKKKDKKFEESRLIHFSHSSIVE